MDVQCAVTSSGLQDLYTDPDAWICRFTASVIVSRLQLRDAIALQNCQNCINEIKKANNTTPQTSAKTPTALHEAMVDGLIALNEKDLSKKDFLEVFKGVEDFTYYDYVLLANLRKNGMKYMRSKI